MQTAMHADFAQPVNYTVQQLGGDNAQQVAGTVAMMRRYVADDCRNETFVHWLNGKLPQFAGGDYDPCEIAFRLARECFYFQRDETTGGPLASDVVEVLVRPVDAVLLAQNGQKVPGDCDCFSMLVAAILRCFGVTCCFATVAASPANPEAYSHVYVVANPGTEERVAVDASHGKYCGWEAPNLGKYTEWPVDGVMGGSQAVVILLLLVAAFAYVKYGGGN